MISSIRHRIEKLEAADTRRTKRIIWEDGSGSAEREIARLEAAGKLESVQLLHRLLVGRCFCCCGQ